MMKIVASRLVTESAPMPVRLWPMLHPPAVAAPKPIMTPPMSCLTMRLGAGARHLNSPVHEAAINAPGGTPRIIQVPQPRAEVSLISYLI